MWRRDRCCSQDFEPHELVGFCGFAVASLAYLEHTKEALGRLESSGLTMLSGHAT